MVTIAPKTPVDVSPIVVSEIVVEGRRLAARAPLRFEVSLNPGDPEPFLLLEGPLDIILFAETREQLIDGLEDELEILWRDFAVGDQSRLDGSAQRLGAEMRGLFLRATDAAQVPPGGAGIGRQGILTY